MIKTMLMPYDADDEEHLFFNRKAMLYLYEESVSANNPEITRVIGDALSYCDDLIKKFEGDFKWSKDAALYLFFIVAILEMNSKDLETFILMLEWLELMPKSFRERLKNLNSVKEKN